MSRASLLVVFVLVPNFIFGQTTISLNSSAAPHQQGPAQGGQTTLPGTTQSSAPAPSRVITLDEAIDLALANSPSLQGTRTQIQQSLTQEVTADLRPNPTLGGDSQFIPFFSPGQFSQDVEQF